MENENAKETIDKENTEKTQNNNGIKFFDVEGYDPNNKETKMLDLPSSVWNAIAEFYAKYHIGLEVRYCLPLPDRDLPAIMDSPSGIFVIDRIGMKKRTASEQRELKRQNRQDAVYSIFGTLYDANRVDKEVCMDWVPQEMAWRATERLKPFSANEPAVFAEALPGNIKLAAKLDMDAVVRGEIPLPPLFEWDRDDAPKNQNKRIWVLPRPGSVMVKVGETVLDTSSAKIKPMK